MQPKILIIDDDEIVLFLHSVILEDTGTRNTPEKFGSAQAALRYLDRYAENGRQFLLLLDINMPVMNGWAFLDALEARPLPAEISVVLVTSSVDESDRRKALSYRMVNGFLIKPLSAEQISELKKAAVFTPFFLHP